MQALFQQLSNEECAFRVQHGMHLGSLRCCLSAQLPVAAAAMAVAMSELESFLVQALLELPLDSSLRAAIVDGVTPVFAGRHHSVRLPESMTRAIAGAPMTQSVLTNLASKTSMSHEIFASFEILRYSSAVNRFIALLLEGETQSFALEACKDMIAANAVDFLRSQDSVFTNVSATHGGSRVVSCSDPQLTLQATYEYSFAHADSSAIPSGGVTVCLRTGRFKRMRSSIYDAAISDITEVRFILCCALVAFTCYYFLIALLTDRPCFAGNACE